MTQTTPTIQTLIESLVEVLNDLWKVDDIENNREPYQYLTVENGRKYAKLIVNFYKSQRVEQRSVYCFIDRESGAVYKPASWKSPAKGVRFYVEQLVETPLMCDRFGSFLYQR